MLIATRIPQRDSPVSASFSFRFSPFLPVCVHVLCHNGTWVLHKMCSVVFLLLFFRSVANRTSFTCVSGISCCDTAPSNMNNLFLLLLLCFVCWFLLALVFLFFTRGKSRTRGERGGGWNESSRSKEKMQSKFFLRLFALRPLGQLIYACSLLLNLPLLLQLLIIAHNSSTPNEMPDCTCNLRP